MICFHRVYFPYFQVVLQFFVSYDSQMRETVDQIDKSLLRELQKDGGLSQRELADRVGVSQNACWRRLRNLSEAGVLLGSTARVDRRKLGLDMVVFMMLRTRHHSADWLQEFRRHVLTIPEVVDFHRIGGDYDYQLKVVTEDMAGYDKVYQRLIKGVELDSVTSYFAMESIAEGRPLPL
jgi:Lrp/AsnC family transcriptional regulator, cysteine-sensing transcriptional activator